VSDAAVSSQACLGAALADAVFTDHVALFIVCIRAILLTKTLLIFDFILVAFHQFHLL
jgi:hypothetical protein